MKRSSWLAIGAVLVVVGGVGALVLTRVFVFSMFKTPSSSMYPSLPVSSHLGVHKLDSKPTYGAVMVFRYPEHPEQDFVKRVVALAGDRVETHGTVVAINGWAVPHCSVGLHAYDDPVDALTHHTGTLEVEWLGDETYLVFHDDKVLLSDFGPYTVASGEYFVMGDNRENSHDSRMWLMGAGGGVPLENTVGRVSMGKLALPRGAESLRASLDACLARPPSRKRP